MNGSLKTGALALFLLAASSCGGGPTEPALAPYTLRAGEHRLVISVWITTSSNPYGFTRSELVCSGTGSTSATLVVDVTQEGPTWVVRARTGDLVLRLSDASRNYEGSMVGTAGSGGVSVIVNDPAQLTAPATLPPAVSSYNLIGGRIEGSVRFVSNQGEQSCSNNIWTLSPAS